MAFPTIAYTEKGYAYPDIAYTPIQIESYRGFQIVRRNPYMLYFINIPGAPKGFVTDLVARLKGNYTKLSALRADIDKWFLENPTASHLDAFIQTATKRGRGRPPNAARELEQQLADQQIEETEETLDNEQQQIGD